VIIQCKECGTQYRFDKTKIDGEGVWVRCSRCDAVFFQENPLAEIASLMESMEAGGDIHKGGDDEDADDIIDKMFGEDDIEDDEGQPEYRESYDELDEIMEETDPSEKEVMQRPRRAGWIIALCLLVVLLCGGIYLWISPHARDVVLPRIEKIFGIEAHTASDTGVYGLEVSLVNVKERFVKNPIVGDIMIIEGFAVNKNKVAISTIKIKGKILDSSGAVLSQEESNCGTILTDDELKSLTGEEIRKELSNPYGREYSNIDIQPDTDIPFMLAFVMPASEASEFVVELAGVEVANSK